MTLVQWDMLSLEHGSIAAVAQGDRLLRICYEGSSADLFSAVRSFYPQAERRSHLLTDECLKQLDEYFLGKRRVFRLPLGVDSLSPFAYKVHLALVRVPYGTVVSYGELAVMVGSPQAARAVGRVMSSNPWPLLVPCHRVVNAGGRIGHYSAAHGSRTKAWLIEFEREHADVQIALPVVSSP